VSVFKNATVVVVHGAWEPVIRELQKEGLNVVAAPIPLTSLSDDAAALNGRSPERKVLSLLPGTLMRAQS
jgi:hypothetical protein